MAELTKAERREAAEALQEAIANIGGPAKVAELFGIHSQAVSQWDLCPHDKVIRTSLEGRVSATRLRPDLYPKGTVLPHETRARKRAVGTA